MLLGLDHVGFTVGNLDRSIAFYTRLLEAEPVLRKTWDVEYVGRIVGYPRVVLDCAFWRLPWGTTLELLEYKEQPARVDMETFNVGNGHLCLVTEDMARDYERLRDHATFRSAEPVSIPWGPYEGGAACYLRDPDGISIELIELPPGGPRLEEAVGEDASSTAA
jgi:catechol 2,3-dioxygenase-like lactoylglutathione lyase family enzyme